MDCRKCISFRQCNQGILIKPDYPIKLKYFTSYCSGYRFLGKNNVEEVLKKNPVIKYELIDDYLERRCK